MNKKIILGIVVLLSVVLILSFVLTIGFLGLGPKSDNKSTEELNFEFVNNSDSIIYILGDEIDFKYLVDIEYINNIEDVKQEKTYITLIINDQDSSFDITQEEYDMLDSYIEDGILFIYLGDNLLDEVNEVLYEGELEVENLYGVAYYKGVYRRESNIGFWTVSDYNASTKYTLAERIIGVFKKYIEL
ncbi:MAG: hypothetical protein R3Y05_00535 [bacterium]